MLWWILIALIAFFNALYKLFEILFF